MQEKERLGFFRDSHDGAIVAHQEKRTNTSVGGVVGTFFVSRLGGFFIISHLSILGIVLGDLMDHRITGGVVVE